MHQFHPFEVILANFDQNGIYIKIDINFELTNDGKNTVLNNFSHRQFHSTSSLSH